MADWTNIVVAVAVGVVALVVLLGFINMARGGGGARSQNLMRWRVALQFLALLIILAVLYFRK
jgi:hypothetical protein